MNAQHTSSGTSYATLPDITPQWPDACDSLSPVAIVLLGIRFSESCETPQSTTERRSSRQDIGTARSCKHLKCSIVASAEALRPLQRPPRTPLQPTALPDANAASYSVLVQASPPGNYVSAIAPFDARAAAPTHIHRENHNHSTHRISNPFVVDDTNRFSDMRANKCTSSRDQQQISHTDHFPSHL